MYHILKESNGYLIDSEQKWYEIKKKTILSLALNLYRKLLN